MISNARMYAVTPEVAGAWRRLLLRVGVLADVAWRYEEHAAPLPVSALWDRGDLGAAFMCGLPFITRSDNAAAAGLAAPVLLGAPVPRLARYAGKPVYFSEFVARADADFADLPSAFGKRLAHMLPESNSGYNAPRFHLMQLVSGRSAAFHDTSQPTPTPMAVLRAVLDGQAEVGVVDSYVLDLLRRHKPDLMAPLATLATTMASPMPALVASPAMDEAAVQRVRAALLGAHQDTACRADMDLLLLDHFAAVAPADYRVLAERRRAADDHGFALTSA